MKQEHNNQTSQEPSNMKTINIFTRTFLIVMTTFIGVVAEATPTIDSITVQGFMRKADDLQVTDGTYNIAYMVLQGGAVVWGREYSTVVTDGLFSKTLSGLGQDLTVGAAWSHCTGEADFSAATLNPALLIGAGAGATVVRVCSRSVINLVQPEFDVTISAAPTALIADTAYNLVDGNLTVNAFAAGEAVDTSAGVADAGKVVLLDAAGLIDDSMIPPTLDIAGAVTVGGAASTSVTVSSGAGAVTIGGAGNTGVTVGSGSGTVTVGGAANTTVTVGGTGLTTLGLGNSATGALAATLGSTAGASSTTVQSGTGGVAITSTGTTATAVNITASGVGGGITLSPQTTGSAVINNAKIVPRAQTVALAALATTIAADGSAVLNVTPAGACTIATITGCSTGTYAQGERILVLAVGNGGAACTFTDTAVATATANSMVLSAAFTLANAATTRGTSIELMCTTLAGTMKWVEIGRTVNAN